MGAVTILRCFQDNYSYLLEYARGLALAVDPGQAEPTVAEMGRRGLKQTHIFITHRHGDHTGGVGRLVKETGCKVYGEMGDASMPPETPDAFGPLELNGCRIRLIATPGHTAQSVCWYVEGGPLQTPAVFTGDTLFVCGCGRVLEGNGEMMLHSLRKLADLPERTLVYPGHEYTEENVRFALTLRPQDAELKALLADVRRLTAQALPTVPSTIGREQRLNPFLNARDAKEFVKIRKMKDIFQ
ncbi:MAG: hydroxyacylglutathione hydrolase [Planctomycetaceae bacterium]|nr:hydroxyacylglutathione hydrolase [Planctomycetaceae bacterium]